jgi:uncharacterized glyoxalase superfamily protein PhnB
VEHKSATQVYNFVLRDLVRYDYEKAIKNGKAGNQGREESWNHSEGNVMDLG